MKNAINTGQEFLIKCDNPNCDYKILNPTGDPNIDVIEYVNMSCPECGENLLTEKDYKDSLRLLKIIDWINKYFSWMTIFSPGTRHRAEIHVHDGINIKNKK